jgi:ABC-type sugar transport system ATPase subunit
MSVAHNITLAKMKALSRFFWLDLKREAAEAAAAIDRFDIVPRDPDREVEYLSGGNQRKTLLGRALFASATLLVLEEPTQGVDVDARRQIHEHLRRLADCETAVVFVSTDLEELIGLADRIVVLRNGRIGQELSPAGLTPDRLLSAIQNQAPEVRMNDV